MLGADALARLTDFGTIIDVRSPAEFAEDHVPGAINLPVLSNAERAQVGTIYVQESRLKANRIGAAYVARNIAAHLEGALRDKGPDFAPLVYCWRGGQRSASMATILSRVGWRTTLLEGGYRTYRRAVRAQLYDTPWPTPVVVLDGDTGTAKTEILNRLRAYGIQIIDLEGLARHRGSLLGSWDGQAQPSQKLFETRLWSALQELVPTRPVLIEAESSKVGDLMIPPGLWRAMQGAPRIRVTAPVEARVGYLVRAYRDVAEDHARLAEVITRLPVHIGAEARKAWLALLAERDYEALARELILGHYDPAYARARRREGRTEVAVIALDHLASEDIDAAAAELARSLQSL